MKPHVFLFPVLLQAGCIDADDPGSTTTSSSETAGETRVPPMDLNSWQPGWTLSYFSNQSRWMNYTYEGEEHIKNSDGGEWDTHRMAVQISPANGEEEGNSTSWLEVTTLGLVRTVGDKGTLRAGCPIARVLPLENITYSCFIRVGTTGFGNLTVDHWIMPSGQVNLVFGSFNETVIQEKSGHPFYRRSYVGYSPEIGFLTRFRVPESEGGLDEEFRLVSARNMPVRNAS